MPSVITTGSFDASAATGNYHILTGHAEQVWLWAGAVSYGWFAWATGEFATALTTACPQLTSGVGGNVKVYSFPPGGGPKYLLWDSTAASGYSIQEIWH